MFIPSHGTNQLYSSLLVSKEEEDAEEEIKSAMGLKVLIAMSCPHGHLWKIRLSEITASTFPRWKVPSIFFLSIIQSLLFCRQHVLCTE